MPFDLLTGWGGHYSDRELCEIRGEILLPAECAKPSVQPTSRGTEFRRRRRRFEYLKERLSPPINRQGMHSGKANW